MANKKKIPPKKSVIEKTRIIFLASCTLIFIFTIFITAIAKSSNLREIKITRSNAEKCIISGCNGEICQSKDEEPIMSTCVYKPEYDCLEKAICEVQENGLCGWTKTKEYQECINNLSK